MADDDDGSTSHKTALLGWLLGNVGKIGWGIVGTGWMARRFAHTLNSLDEAKIVAVCSRDRERANAFKSQHSIEKAYNDESDLINDVSVDVVYIATPHPLHFATAISALEAGKPILCEKPLAMNALEARTIANLANEKGLFCMEALWTRFLPLYRNLKTVITEAGLGQPIALASEFGRPVSFDPDGRFFNPALGGGSLLDLGVYGISVATYLLGAPSDIHSVASIGKTGIDEQCAVFLKYPQGMATLLTSFRRELSNDVQIFCTDGGLRIAPLFIESEKLEVWRLSNDLPPQMEGSANKLARTHPVNWLKRLRKVLLNESLDTTKPKSSNVPLTLEFPSLTNRHAYEALETIRCLREGLTESPILPLAESVLVVEMLDKIRAAWKNP